MEIEKDPREKPLPFAYVENCYKLTVGNLGRGVLKPDVKEKTKEGSFFVGNGEGLIFASFSVDLLSSPKKLLLDFSRGPKLPIRRQEIVLTSRRQGFGERPYFQIGDQRYSTLYRRPDGIFFGSRADQRLRYRSSNRKPTSPVGILSHRLELLEKIRLKNLDVRRVSYGDKLTRRAAAVLRWSKRWNPEKEVEGEKAAI